ncbi:MAG: tyrosine-type recombinase/integrase [Oscillospiraceae bacterium]|nr:tyrosine-type recombinase/integrase [Oscillospiraceae bacterium]
MQIQNHENPDFLNDYITHISVVKGLADSTVMGYYQDIRQFLRYYRLEKTGIRNIQISMLSDMDIQDMTIEEVRAITLRHIYQYYNFMASAGDNKARIRCRKGSSLRSFFKYLTVQAKLLDHNPAENLELSRSRNSLPKYLNFNESMDLLETKSHSEDAASIRDYCILTLFLNCGLRLGELVALNLSSLDMQEETMRILGKGSKERIVYLNSACMTALQDYLAQRMEIQTTETALFLSNQKKRISRRRVQQIVENSLRDAGLAGRGLSAHKLRHTCATLLYQQGNVDLLTLKAILGHESIATTQIYTHLADTAEREAMRCSPLADARRNEKD